MRLNERGNDSRERERRIEKRRGNLEGPAEHRCPMYTPALAWAAFCVGLTQGPSWAAFILGMVLGPFFFTMQSY